MAQPDFCFACGTASLPLILPPSLRLSLTSSCLSFPLLSLPSYNSSHAWGLGTLSLPFPKRCSVRGSLTPGADCNFAAAKSGEMHDAPYHSPIFAVVTSFFAASSWLAQCSGPPVPAPRFDTAFPLFPFPHSSPLPIASPFPFIFRLPITPSFL